MFGLVWEATGPLLNDAVGALDTLRFLHDALL